MLAKDPQTRFSGRQFVLCVAGYGFISFGVGNSGLVEWGLILVNYRPILRLVFWEQKSTAARCTVFHYYAKNTLVESLQQQNELEAKF